MSKDIVQRITELCHQENKTIYEVSTETNIGTSSIKRWNKHAPSILSVVKIADYFNVSVDYLTCRTDIPETTNKIYQDRDIQLICKAKSQMSDKEQRKMLSLLVLVFDEYFNKAAD